MTAGISSRDWHERAKKLNLEWVNGPPRRNDENRLIRCLDCGNEWLVFPANIARGRKSCTPCARAASRIPANVWVNRLAEINAVWLDGTPSNNSDRSKIAKCEVCAGTWIVDPRRISRGHPRCPGRTRNKNLSNATWIERAAQVGIEWIEIPVRSKTRASAQCITCGHKWKPIPDNIRAGSGCPICALRKPTNPGGKRISPEEWDRRAATVGVRWLSGPPSSSNTKTSAICLRCSYSWSPLPSNVSKGSGCPRCARNSSVSEEEWEERAASVGVKWLEPVKSRHSKTNAECLTCGHRWQPEAGQVASGSGCPICGQKQSRRRRALSAETWVRRATEAGIEWLDLPSSNSDKQSARCLSCGYEWHVLASSIASGAGCPVCSGVFVEDSTWEARAAAVNLRWLEIPKSSRLPTPAQCLSCGLRWKPNPGAVTSGSGCPDCAETGYKVGQPGLFYLVERKSNGGRAARKIGITNLSGSRIRLALWKKQGFELVFQKTHQNGRLILNLEQNLLAWLRHDQNLPAYLDKEEMPRGGATETFSPDEPSELVLLEKIESEYLSLCLKYDEG